MSFELNKIPVANLSDCYNQTDIVNNFIKQNIIDVIANGIVLDNCNYIRFSYSETNKLGFLIFYLHGLRESYIHDNILKILLEHINFLKFYNIKLGFYGYTGNLTVDNTVLFGINNNNKLTLNICNLVNTIDLMSNLYYDIPYNISISTTQNIKITNSKKEIIDFLKIIQQYNNSIRIFFNRYIIKSILEILNIQISSKIIGTMELYDLSKLIKNNSNFNF